MDIHSSFNTKICVVLMKSYFYYWFYLEKQEAKK